MTLGQVPGYALAVPPKEYDELIQELTLWCEAQHGRQQEIADEFKVSKQLVSHWLTKRRVPNLENFFKLKAFLAKQRRRSKRGG